MNLKYPLIVLTILFIILNPLNAKTVVVASDQDKSLACQLSNHLNASLVILPWGSTDVKYLNEIKALNPDEVIIVGGKAAVPEIYNYGNYKRYSGKNRAETAYMILSDFYNISSSGELIYYPSKNAIIEFIDEKRNWKVISGNSDISIRWSKFVENQLPRSNDIENETFYVYVGNINNNPGMNESWNHREIPEIVSFSPAVILSNNTLFITGSDENLPITIGRLFSKQDIDYSSSDFFKFIILLAITLGIFYSIIKSRYYLFGAIITILWIIHSFDKFCVVWDTLLVYLDGALSLTYLGHYETIIHGRNFPGLSYCLYFWFKLFSPSIQSILLYQVYLCFILMSFVFLYFKKKELGLAAWLILLSIPLFREYITWFSTELTFLGFMAVILYGLKNSKNSKLNIIVLSIITSISALIRVHIMIIPLIYLIFQRNKNALIYNILSILLYVILLNLTYGQVMGYLDEISIKGGITLDLVINNIHYYLPKFIHLMIIPIFILILEIWNKMKFNNFMLLTGITFLIMPLLWVAQDERYLLPYIFIITMACMEPLEKLDLENIKDKLNNIKVKLGLN